MCTVMYHVVLCREGLLGQGGVVKWIVFWVLRQR